MNYQPKGSMCANCTKKNDDCSKLDFSRMVVIGVFFIADETIKTVKCTEFKREEKALP